MLPPFSVNTVHADQTDPILPFVYAGDREHISDKDVKEDILKDEESPVFEIIQG